MVERDLSAAPAEGTDLGHCEPCCFRVHPATYELMRHRKDAIEATGINGIRMYTSATGGFRPEDATNLRGCDHLSVTETILSLSSSPEQSQT